MRISDIQRCEVRPGRLVEWTFSPATVAAAAALPPDPRPPAYIQESHIRTARSVREDGLFVPTWIGAAFDLPGRAELGALEGALRGWTLRHETLRSGFRWAGDDMHRFTLDEDDVSLRREVVGDFADAATLARYLQDRFDAEADALGWPNLIYAAVVRDDSTSVYLAFDHTNVDAYSVQRIPDEISELYLAGLAGRPVADHAVSSYVDFCEQERANADGIDDTHTIVARWREFIARCGGRLPALPVGLGLRPGGALPAQQLLREPLVDADTAAAFEAYCRPYGGTMVGVLAATSLIVHQLGGQPVYRTVMPFHTRAKSAWSDSVGWYVGGAPIEVPAARDFDTALATVRAELQANRSLARIPLARVLRLLGTDFRPTSPDLYSIVSYVDARVVPGSARWTEQKAYGLIRVSYGDQVCVWVNRLHEGLWLACRYPDTDLAYKNIRRYTEALRELVVSVPAPDRVRAAEPTFS
ncbi:condensation domain-containing protein [Streptomyces sp. NPDC007205]|uniref:condensation domain-containing protein n=1 Tax=Streptomyces sp. NPDC007205 TaxID=3154316 RepID=UPI0033C736DF